MSGILGIWNQEGLPIESALLAKMCARLAHRGKDHEGRWFQGSVALACQLLRAVPESSTEIQPAVHPTGTVLVFDGRLDNREDLLRSLPALHHHSGPVPDAALVLAAYESFGERFPERLLGDFALGLFDPRIRHLILARDAVGLRPLYFWAGHNTFLFASEIKAILAHPLVRARPDEDLLADFLLGQVGAPQGLTFFQDIRSLLPGYCLTVTPHGTRSRRYWDFDLTQSRRLAAFEDYVEEFRFHFHNAVKRRLRSASPVTVSLSGGLASSSIFCLAETLHRNKEVPCRGIHGVFYTPPGDTSVNEQDALHEIERAYGVSILKAPQGPPGFIKYSKQLVRQVEAPFLDGQWTATLKFLETAESLGSRVILGGQWADKALFSQAYLVDLVVQLRWRLLLQHLRERGRWVTPSANRHFRRRFFLDVIKEALPEWVLSFLGRYRLKPGRPWYTEAFERRARIRAGARPPSPDTFSSVHARSLYEEIRSGHLQLCLDWHNKVAAMRGLDIAFPFLDRELLSFLMSLPGEVLNWKGIPKALLREALRGVLPEPVYARTWRSDSTRLIIDGIEWDYRELVHVVHSDPLAVSLGYVRPEVLRPELNRLRACLRQDPSCDQAWTLSDLIGLELWLQAFWGDSGHLSSSDGSRNEVSVTAIERGQP